MKTGKHTMDRQRIEKWMSEKDSYAKDFDRESLKLLRESL